MKFASLGVTVTADAILAEYHEKSARLCKMAEKHGAVQIYTLNVYYFSTVMGILKKLNSQSIHYINSLIYSQCASSRCSTFEFLEETNRIKINKIKCFLAPNQLKNRTYRFYIK